MVKLIKTLLIITASMAVVTAIGLLTGHGLPLTIKLLMAAVAFIGAFVIIARLKDSMFAIYIFMASIWFISGVIMPPTYPYKITTTVVELLPFLTEVYQPYIWAISSGGLVTILLMLAIFVVAKFGKANPQEDKILTTE